jgi:hypothetical protein
VYRHALIYLLPPSDRRALRSEGTDGAELAYSTSKYTLRGVYVVYRSDPDDSMGVYEEMFIE